MRTGCFQGGQPWPQTEPTEPSPLHSTRSSLSRIVASLCAEWVAPLTEIFAIDLLTVKTPFVELEIKVYIQCNTQTQQTLESFGYWTLLSKKIWWSTHFNHPWKKIPFPKRIMYVVGSIHFIQTLPEKYTQQKKTKKKNVFCVEPSFPPTVPYVFLRSFRAAAPSGKANSAVTLSSVTFQRPMWRNVGWYLDLPPSQDASHHQEYYIFNRGIPT